MDSATGTPIAVMDAAELTMVRTSCVAMLAVSCLSPAAAPRVAIIGSGPQAVAHAEAARVLGASHVHAVVRSDAAAVRARALAASRGLELDVAGPEVLASSDVIVCATSSPVPVLDDADVAEHAVVAAIGAHEAHTRELPTSLMGRASVYVETRRSALADSGNVLIAERELGRHIITGELAELVSGTVRVPSDRPRVFVSVGESWEDLAVASVLAGAHR
jgi:ornithine cyclodeaminase